MTKENASNIHDVVLNKLAQKSQRPIELLRDLSKQGYATKEIKSAFAQLLYDGDIELTTAEQFLQPRKA